MRSNGAVRYASVLGFAALVLMTGCSEDLGPIEWEATPDTVDLFTWNREEFQGLPSGYDLLAGEHGQRIVVDDPGASGNWDFALLEDEDGFHFLPAGSLEGLDVGSGIGLLPDAGFESVTRVPGSRDTYSESESIAVELDRIYAVRSRRFYGFGGQSCSLYGKLSPVSIDLDEGVLRFVVIRNPNCNDRSMVPPKK